MTELKFPLNITLYSPRPIFTAHINNTVRHNTKCFNIYEDEVYNRLFKEQAYVVDNG